MKYAVKILVAAIFAASFEAATFAEGKIDWKPKEEI